ncbi:MAG: T9SS type A sorting domain-containing protein [Flavobacteriales bacterium]|nr:T9SS type A sorting domain-containing protein [Flavobacteriales bacterium]
MLVTGMIAIQSRAQSDGICPDSIYVYPFNVSDFTFNIFYLDEGQTVTWNFGDGTEVTAFEEVDHFYSIGGSYVVTATFSDADCPDQNVVLSVGITANDPDCTIEIQTGDGSCNLWFLKLGGEDLSDVVQSTWYFDGEWAGTSTTEFTYIFEETGWIDVCVEVEMAECANLVYACTPLLVSSCGMDECDVTPTIITNPTDESCDSLSLDFGEYGIDIINVVGLGTPYAVYNANQPTITIPLGPGENQVCAHLEYLDEVCYWCGMFEGCEAAICPDSIIVNQLDSVTFEFSIDGIDEGQPVTWNFGDGTEIVDDATIEHSFPVGTFLVTATFMDMDCPWDGPTILSTTVSIYTDCSLALSVEAGEDGAFTFTATGEPITLPLYWDFGDGTQIEATWVTDNNYNPGTYLVCAWFVNELCPDTTSACIELVVEQQVICPDTIVMSDDCLLTVPGVPLDAGGNWAVTECGSTQQFKDMGASLFYQFAGLCDPFEVCFSNDSLSTLGCPTICQEIIPPSNCIVGISEFAELPVVVYPNPTSGQLTIENPDGGTLVATLWDVLGNELIIRNIVGNTNTIDLSGLAPAVYILGLEGVGGQTIIRIIRQ